ncbi:TetR/AcrR family transcriptional regulator [Desulfobotulus sp.]|uniref:TetR/AcrR family transcriptional regulator n=1 Tax=Desulfobotulus sp. TaxID=1940337 RepID=UPI002A36336B|nr:TetR/AcrR family transcriptional regulator [Desulfobotulus sp.]MDY0162910.1 TetR/AcrR family transcriptional regulator [Desulfobotulus sp.]
MDQPPLTRREREKIRQRQEMLDAALLLFSEKGYHNVSMQEIAEKSEFAIGTLYKFFQNKEDLYKAMVLDQCDRFDLAFTQALDAAEPVTEKLRSYIQAKGDMFRENLAFVRLFLAESKGASFNLNAGLDEEVRARYTLFLEKVAEVFARGIREKIFREIAPPFTLAVVMDNILDAFLLLWLEKPEEHPYPENPGTILDILFKGLLVS